MTSTSISGGVAAVCVGLFSCYAVAVSYCQLDVATTLAWLPIVALLNFAVVRLSRGFYPSTFNTDIHREQHSVLTAKRFQLVGMPISHFVEKVRWCMDIIRCPYEEVTVGGLLTMFGRGRSVPFLLDSQSCSVIGNSDEILMYLHGVFVPALLASLPPSSVDPSSAAKRLAIEKLFERNYETLEFEKELNTFGHAIQGWAYSYHLALFGNPNPAVTFLAWGGAEPRVPLLHRLLITALYPVFKIALNITFQLYDEKLREERREVIRVMLDKVDAMLIQQKVRHAAEMKIQTCTEEEEVGVEEDVNEQASDISADTRFRNRVTHKSKTKHNFDRGVLPAGALEEVKEYQPFLFGDHISYVDLTFCALVAPLVGYSVVFPRDGSESLYATGRFSSFRCYPHSAEPVAHDVLMRPNEVLLQLEDEIINHRPCGQYILNMYRNHRKQPII